MTRTRTRTRRLTLIEPPNLIPSPNPSNLFPSTPTPNQDEEDTWLDHMLTRAALGALVAVAGAWAYMRVHMLVKGEDGGVGGAPPLPRPSFVSPGGEL